MTTFLAVALFVTGVTQIYSAIRTLRANARMRAILLGDPPEPASDLGGCQHPDCGEPATVEVGEVFDDGLGDREVFTGMLAAFCKRHTPVRG